MSWLFNPDEWPRSPQQWVALAARWPVTPRQWLELADELSRSPTRLLINVLEGVAASFVGRVLEARAKSGRVTMHLRSLTGSHDDPPVAMGALRPSLDIEGIERVEAVAEDVRWAHGAIDHLEVEARNVALAPGIVASLVAGPVTLRGRVGQATLDEWNERADSALRRVELVGEGMVRAWIRRGVAADVGIELAEDEAGSSEVRFHVRRVRVLGVPVPGASRLLPSRVAPVPLLPRDLRLVSLEAHPDELRVEARIERYEEPVNLEQVLRAASTVGSRVILTLREEG